jgi:hypothetical protein
LGQYVRLKHCYKSTRLYSASTQKTVMNDIYLNALYKTLMIRICYAIVVAVSIQP